MSTLNRKAIPPSKAIDDIKVPGYSVSKLSNGIPVYILEGSAQKAVRVELVFDAGAWYSEHPLVPLFTNLMLNEGCKKYNSAQTAEKLDYYGSYLQLNADRDFAEATLFTLNKFLPQTLEVMQNILTEPQFPEEEFNILINNKKQKFLIDDEKVKTLAARKFSEVLFGARNPYGRPALLKDYNSLTTGQLQDFHHRLYHAGNCRIYLSGWVDGKTMAQLEEKLGSLPRLKKSIEKSVAKPVSSPEKYHYIEKKDAVQSALRIGRPVIHKSHPDYPELQILNTVFGGYFGSRLMANIREDKGYTYGIGSGVSSFRNAAFFTIVSEVGSHVAKDALKEIYKELDALKTKLIPVAELERVRSYLLGEFIRMFDGPFNQSDSLRSAIDFGLDNNFYITYLEKLKKTTPARLKELAGNYLRKEDMFEVVAGKK